MDLEKRGDKHKSEVPRMNAKEKERHCTSQLPFLLQNAQFNRTQAWIASNHSSQSILTLLFLSKSISQIKKNIISKQIGSNQNHE